MEGGAQAVIQRSSKRCNRNPCRGPRRVSGTISRYLDLQQKAHPQILPCHAMSCHEACKRQTLPDAGGPAASASCSRPSAAGAGGVRRVRSSSSTCSRVATWSRASTCHAATSSRKQQQRTSSQPIALCAIFRCVSLLPACSHHALVEVCSMQCSGSE
jgi:hypothetical protein